MFGLNVADGWRLARRIGRDARSLAESARYLSIIEKYRSYTMVPRGAYLANLRAAAGQRHVRGSVVECGVWRGGMIAGLAEVLGRDRPYYLFDSFEGLPPAQAIDGPAAAAWQADRDSPSYYDNCRAEQSFAESAMRLCGAQDYVCVKGWFDQTLPNFQPKEPIAVLRIDADWYDSVMCSLVHLEPHLCPDALVILDDYFTWDGCSKAVHQFLADRQSAARLTSPHPGVCTIRGLGRRPSL